MIHLPSDPVTFLCMLPIAASLGICLAIIKACEQHIEDIERRTLH